MESRNSGIYEEGDLVQKGSIADASEIMGENQSNFFVEGTTYYTANGTVIVKEEKKEIFMD